MPFQIKNIADHTILHQNNYVAEDFNSTQLVEDTMTLQFPFAEAEMKQWYFEGIRIGYTDWHYTEYVALEWQGDLDMVTLYFNLKGRTTLTHTNLERVLDLGSYHHNMFYANSGAGTMKNEELRLTTFIIQFTKDAFLRLTQDSNDVLKHFGEKVKQGKSVVLSEQYLVMDLAIYHAINAVITCPYQGGLKKMFLLSKALEIVVLQTEIYNRSQTQKPVYCKTDYDKERIIFARDYLLQHMEMPPSLSELARVVGINEFKLKRGFKEIFNNTVFGYLSDFRLELAKNDLLANKKSATEIAFDLGYSSLQHFSTAFKKKFGLSPKQL